MLGKKTPVLFHLDNELDEQCNDSRKKCEGFQLLVSCADKRITEFSEWTYVRKDGAKIPVQLSISPIKSSGDQLTGYLVMANDLSSFKKAERELKQLVDLAQSQNDRLKNFPELYLITFETTPVILMAC